MFTHIKNGGKKRPLRRTSSTYSSLTTAARAALEHRVETLGTATEARETTPGTMEARLVASVLHRQRRSQTRELRGQKRLHSAVTSSSKA